MEALLYIIIAGLVIYIIWSKSQKKKEEPKPIPKSQPSKSTPKSPPPEPTQEKSINNGRDISQAELLQHMQNKIPSEHYTPKKDIEDTSSYFYGKKVCITGTLDSFPIRPELSEHLWNLGADIDSQITKNLDILICGDNPGPSKCRKADDQGVHVMDEDELIEKLDGFTSKYV